LISFLLLQGFGMFRRPAPSIPERFVQAVPGMSPHLSAEFLYPGIVEAQSNDVY